MSNQIKGTLNRVELIGWLGNDPSQRFLASGVGVCDFDVATKRVGSLDEHNNRIYDTEWITIEAWDTLSDICQDRLHKGSLRTRSWEDKESGARRSRTIVRADDVLFLDAPVREDE